MSPVTMLQSPNIDGFILPSQEENQTESVDIEDLSKEQEDAKEVERKRDEFLMTLDASQAELFDDKIDEFIPQPSHRKSNTRGFF